MLAFLGTKRRAKAGHLPSQHVYGEDHVADISETAEESVGGSAPLPHVLID
jgi:hypothetical protein